MGTVQKKSAKPRRKPLTKEQKLDRELRDCMHCKYFWGNNSQCLIKQCYKEKKKPIEEKTKSECDGCPYGQGKNYCFPCMKKILGK